MADLSRSRRPARTPGPPKRLKVLEKKVAVEIHAASAAQRRPDGELASPQGIPRPPLNITSRAVIFPAIRLKIALHVFRVPRCARRTPWLVRTPGSVELGAAPPSWGGGEGPVWSESSTHRIARKSS